MSAQEYWTVTNGARQLLTAWEEPIGRLRLIAHNEAAVRDYPLATTVPAGVEGLSGSTYGVTDRKIAITRALTSA